jgi:hypothetical protein
MSGVCVSGSEKGGGSDFSEEDSVVGTGVGGGSKD